MDKYPTLPEDYKPGSSYIAHELLPQYQYNVDRFIQCKDPFQKNEYLRVIKKVHNKIMVEDKIARERQERRDMLDERQAFEAKLKEEQLKKEWEIEARKQTKKLIQEIIDTFNDRNQEINELEEELDRIENLSNDEINYNEVKKSGKGGPGGISWENIYNKPARSRKYYVDFWVKHQREMNNLRRRLSKREYNEGLAVYLNESIESFGRSVMAEMGLSPLLLPTASAPENKNKKDWAMEQWAQPVKDKHPEIDNSDNDPIEITVDWLEGKKYHQGSNLKGEEAEITLFHRSPPNRPLMVYQPSWKKLKVWGDEELEGRILIVEGVEFTPLKKHKGYFKAYKK